MITWWDLSDREACVLIEENIAAERPRDVASTSLTQTIVPTYACLFTERISAFWRLDDDEAASARDLSGTDMQFFVGRYNEITSVCCFWLNLWFWRAGSGIWGWHASDALVMTQSRLHWLTARATRKCIPLVGIRALCLLLFCDLLAGFVTRPILRIPFLPTPLRAT